MTARQQYETLFHRSEHNPILTAADWPYPAHTVFNAGATRLPDGTTLLLCRVEDRRGHFAPLRRALDERRRRLGRSMRSRRFCPIPRIIPKSCGASRIRASRSSTSSASTRSPTPRSARAARASRWRSPRTFVTFERCGLVMQPDDKDAALLPRRIDGRFALVHRPMADSGAHVWISYSPDLRNWGGHKLMLQARRGAWWDANKVGLSPPLIETERGWLMLYHGVRSNRRRQPLSPRRGALRARAARATPAPRRRMDLRPGGALRDARATSATSTFPCGYTIGADGDTINLYYGAADTCIALATGSIREILDWLDRHGRT